MQTETLLAVCREKHAQQFQLGTEDMPGAVKLKIRQLSTAMHTDNLITGWEERWERTVLERAYKLIAKDMAQTRASRCIIRDIKRFDDKDESSSSIEIHITFDLYRDGYKWVGSDYPKDAELFDEENWINGMEVFEKLNESSLKFLRDNPDIEAKVSFIPGDGEACGGFTPRTEPSTISPAKFNSGYPVKIEYQGPDGKWHLAFSNPTLSIGTLPNGRQVIYIEEPNDRA